MKRTMTALLAALVMTGARAQNTYYSLCPHSELPSSSVKAAGSGSSGYLSAAVAMDPSADPVWARLQGQQVVGVRCYLRTAYEQEFDERSYVMISEGEPADKPSAATKYKFADFNEGWNEVLFDEPYTIGSQKLYVGYGVLETAGSPWPAVSYCPGRVSHTPDGYNINIGRKGWESYTDRGTLLIEAILSDEAAPLLASSAYAQVAEAPLMVEPSKQVAGSIYVKNLTPGALTEITLDNLGMGDSEAKSITLAFDTPIAAYDGRAVAAAFYTGQQEDKSATVSLTPTEINGQAAAECRPGVTEHYVTSDAFTRIPLIEEFTSQRCTNCPRMAYYVHKAMSQYPGPLLFCTHHSGFAEDSFTSEVDKQLLFLFADGGYGYNPAIMFDRTIMSGQTIPVMALPATNVEVYLDLFEQASLNPAMAEVNVEADMDGEKLSVNVSGRVNSSVLAGTAPVYLSTYLIEDGIPYADYPQMGMDNSEAPDDLHEVLHAHDGVIRNNFCTKATGDKLTANDDGTYSVTYSDLPWQSKWNWDNCRVIAFVHYFSSLKVAQNAVLNAGSNKLTTGGSSVTAVEGFRTAERYYDLSGRRVENPRKGGIYIIDGKKIAL